MMKATEVQEGNQLLIRVEGRLSGPWVQELGQSWSQAADARGAANVQVELAGVSFIDEDGKQLLRKMCRAGSRIIAAGCLTRAIVEEVEGKPPKGRQRFGAKGIVCLLAALMLFSGRLAAQKPPAQPADAPILKLTLHDAVIMALKQNPQVQIGMIDLAESQQNANISRSRLLPQASLDVSDRAERANIEANFGKPFPSFPEHIGPFQVFDAGTQFSMPIFDLTLWQQWRASRFRQRQSAADSDNVREQVTLLVVSQYLDSLRAAANVRAAQVRVRLAQALYQQADDLQHRGVGTGLDTLRANVELQNEQQNLIQAQTDAKTSLYGLAQLLNVNPRTRLVLNDQLSFYQTPPFTAQESIAQAIENRPDLKAIDQQELSLEADRRAAGEERLPTLNFQGQYLQEGISAATVIPTYVYEAHVRVPLFTGGRIHAQQASANLALDRLAQQKQNLVNQIALQVKTAVARLDAARHEVAVANLGVTLAQQEVTQARDRFQAGVADNIEVVTAQDALARANDNQIGALFQYNTARADLARATGQMQYLYAK
ncbi:MAG TPA: TolC family protein [Candidatus Dormibacteraeota bacterium]|nr:TolC family protein [Candidatus Dormibacteraeota bacterium]